MSCKKIQHVSESEIWVCGAPVWARETQAGYCASCYIGKSQYEKHLSLVYVPSRDENKQIMSCSHHTMTK